MCPRGFTSGTVVSVTDLLFAVLFIAVLFMIAGPLAWIPLLMLPVMIATGIVLQFPLERAMRKLQLSDDLSLALYLRDKFAE